jgi:hypothetical protein
MSSDPDRNEDLQARWVSGEALPSSDQAELLGGLDHIPASDVQRRDELRPLEAVQRVREA